MVLQSVMFWQRKTGRQFALFHRIVPISKISKTVLFCRDKILNYSVSRYILPNKHLSHRARKEFIHEIANRIQKNFKRVSIFYPQRCVNRLQSHRLFEINRSPKPTSATREKETKQINVIVTNEHQLADATISLVCLSSRQQRIQETDFRSGIFALIDRNSNEISPIKGWNDMCICTCLM